MKLKERKQIAIEDPRQCAGINNQGLPCARKPPHGSKYCLSHASHMVPKFGIYSHALNSSLKELEAEVFNQGRYEELKKTDLEDELALARLTVMQLINDPFYNTKPTIRLKALETIAKIAKTIKQIAEVDAAALRKEFLDSLLNAVSFAFHAANQYTDPAERTRAFINELALFFPNPDDIEGTAMLLPGSDEDDLDIKTD